MSRERLPSHFAPALPAIDALHAQAGIRGVTPLALAVAFVNAVPEVDCAVFGVTAVEELDQILEAASLPATPEWYRGCAIRDENILNPARWPRP